MSAEAIAKALGGRQSGGNWMARCPSHDDHAPSLSIRDAGDGKVLVHCHAGCEQARVIGELRARGLWDERATGLGGFIDRRSQQATRCPTEQDLVGRTAAALRIWQSAEPASNTPVETYLRSRGIHLSPPPTIHFHPRLKHPSRGFWPGMVALVTRGTDNLPLAVHRTFLSHSGIGKAPVEPQKMMLGPCRGGSVRLGPLGNLLLVGEGIETCLASMQATGLPAWAALSTSGLRNLALPEETREVIVLADGDEPGETAALDAARRWKREDRRVRIARPPRGMDFNDVLLGRPVLERERIA